MLSATIQMKPSVKYTGNVQIKCTTLTITLQHFKRCELSILLLGLDYVGQQAEVVHLAV